MAQAPRIIADRVTRLRRVLRKHRIDRLLLTDPIDVGYMSGFTGDDSWLLTGKGKGWLVTDSRYDEQAEAECPALRILVRRGSMIDALKTVVEQQRLTAIGFDPETVTVSLLGNLRRALRGVRLVPAPGLVKRLRVIKDESEVRAIRAAVRVAEHAFGEFRKKIRPGMTEMALVAELEHQLRLAGSDGPAFPTIIAVDASASMPHARPGGRRLKRGSILLVDFGAKVGGYVSDLTRVLLPGRIPPRIREAYELVRAAQAAGIARVGPGVAFTDADAAVRGTIAAAGFGKAFQHGTGHGIGRQVHEAPSLGPRAPKGCLEPGMVVTVEPGVYFRGHFGIRIEDDVLVTPTGRDVLSHLEKDLEAVVW